MSAVIMSKEPTKNNEYVFTLIDAVNISLKMFHQKKVSNTIYLPKEIEMILFGENILHSACVKSNIFIDLSVIRNFKVISVNLINMNQNMAFVYLPELNLIAVDATSLNSSSKFFPKSMQGLDIVYLSNTSPNDSYLLNEVKDYLNI